MITHAPYTLTGPSELNLSSSLTWTTARVSHLGSCSCPSPHTFFSAADEDFKPNLCCNFLLNLAGSLNSCLANYICSMGPFISLPLVLCAWTTLASILCWAMTNISRTQDLCTCPTPSWKMLPSTSPAELKRQALTKVFLDQRSSEWPHTHRTVHLYLYWLGSMIQHFYLLTHLLIFWKLRNNCKPPKERSCVCFVLADITL